MADLYDNYRLIEEVKERAVSRGSSSIVFEPADIVAKVERNNGTEEDFREFGDYHAPNNVW